MVSGEQDMSSSLDIDCVQHLLLAQSLQAIDTEAI
jgi:hypothetical protein